MNRWRSASSSVLNFDLAIFILRTKLVALISYCLLFYPFTKKFEQKISNSCLDSWKFIVDMWQHREWTDIFVQYCLAILWNVRFFVWYNDYKHLQRTLTKINFETHFYPCIRILSLFLVITRYIFKEYIQWSPFHDLEINLIQLNMRQMKVKSVKIEVKNSLVWVQIELVRERQIAILKILTMKVKNNYNVDEATDFIFDGNQSDLSGLSSDEEENDEIQDVVRNNVLVTNQLMLQNLAMIFFLLL